MFCKWQGWILVSIERKKERKKMGTGLSGNEITFIFYFLNESVEITICS